MEKVIKCFEEKLVEHATLLVIVISMPLGSGLLVKPLRFSIILVKLFLS